MKNEMIDKVYELFDGYIRDKDPMTMKKIVDALETEKSCPFAIMDMVFRRQHSYHVPFCRKFTEMAVFSFYFPAYIWQSYLDIIDDD